MTREQRLEAAIELIQSTLASKTIVTRPVGREEQNERIAELWNLGWSRVEISRRLGMNRTTVSNRLLKLADAGRLSHE